MTNEFYRIPKRYRAVILVLTIISISLAMMITGIILSLEAR